MPPRIGETSDKGLFMLKGLYRDGLHLSSLLAPAHAGSQDPERMVPYLDEPYRNFESAWR